MIGNTCYMRPSNLTVLAMKKQIIIPVIVGIKKEAIVHLRLWVSFFIVKVVVAQGQCISENIITHMAVSQVHPLAISRFFSSVKLLNSNMLPAAI